MSFFLVSRVPEAIFLLLAVVQGKRKGNTASHKGGKFPNLGTPGVLPKNHRPLVHHRPRSVRRKLAQLVVDHITLLGCVLISACCVAKLGIVHQSVPPKAQRLLSHLGSVHLVPTLWALQRSMPCVMVQRSKKTKKIKTRKSHEDRVWIHECSTSCGPIRGYHETEAASKKMDTARCFPARNFGERRVKRTSRPLFSSVWM